MSFDDDVALDLSDAFASRVIRAHFDIYVGSDRFTRYGQGQFEVALSIGKGLKLGSESIPGIDLDKDGGSRDGLAADTEVTGDFHAVSDVYSKERLCGECSAEEQENSDNVSWGGLHGDCLLVAEMVTL